MMVMCARVRAGECVRGCVGAGARVCACVCACVCVCMYACMYVCVPARVCNKINKQFKVEEVILKKLIHFLNRNNKLVVLQYDYQEHIQKENCSVSLCSM